MSGLRDVLLTIQIRNVFLCGTTLLSILYFAIWHMRGNNIHVDNGANLGLYLVDTPVCKIPNMNPYDNTIRHIVRKTETLTCPSNLSITYEVGLQLRMNWTAINSSSHKGNIIYCKYTPIHRPKDMTVGKDYWKYLNSSEPFTGYVNITHDFVRVDCFNKSGHQLYTNIHAFIQPNITRDEELSKRFKRHEQQDSIKENLNVIMIVVDTVSRLNFLRQMVKTGQFLSETLDAVDMNGYNKVADNTFPNMMPVTLGKFVEEMPWNYNMSKLTFDNFNFIWKQYSKKGYRTLYAEDFPKINMFEFLKAGFAKPPTDYYYRPMALAMEKKSDLWSSKHHCFQDRLEAKIVLDYLYNFIETFQHVPHFGFTFFTRDTHDNINGAGSVDEAFYTFFKKLHDNDLIRNTIIVFFSDHGYRSGRIRKTYIGMMEERLPFMSVTVPRWLKKKYAHINDHLQINRNRLSTPFDVYETLGDILFFNGTKQLTDIHARGISWFREIPTDRSCDQAGILPHWCTCVGYEKIQVTDNIAKKVSTIILAEINDMLANYSAVCETLFVSQIQNAARRVESAELVKLRKEEAGDTYSEFEYVQLVLTTSPGNAIFDATARIDPDAGTHKIVGDVSRLNLYGHQADCIDDFHLRKFCYCKKHIKY